jgi:hypothetical protein
MTLLALYWLFAISSFIPIDGSGYLRFALEGCFGVAALWLDAD